MVKDLDEQAGDLAYARIAAKELTETLVGSAQYRKLVVRLLIAFKALDESNAFREIDEHTGQEDPEDTLARIKAGNLPVEDPYPPVQADTRRREVIQDRAYGEGVVYGRLPNNPPGPSVADVMFGGGSR